MSNEMSRPEFRSADPPATLSRLRAGRSGHVNCDFAQPAIATALRAGPRSGTQVGTSHWTSLKGLPSRSAGITYNGHAAACPYPVLTVAYDVRYLVRCGASPHKEIPYCK